MKVMTIVKEFNFDHTPMDTYDERWEKAHKDVHIFSMWETGNLSGRDARFALAKNNGWVDVPTLSEFKEIAAGLGYFKHEVPLDRQFGKHGEIK